MSGESEGGEPDVVQGLPRSLARILPEDTVRTWMTLAPHLPGSLYLGGGTAVAVHLGHRTSRDLDFFFHDHAVDLERLLERIGELGEFAGRLEDPGTLRGLFGATKLEVFDAGTLMQLRPTQRISGLMVASIEDLLAMKLKVMSERGEMRDYFDVKEIDERTPLSVEEGIGLYRERYRIAPDDQAPIRTLIAAMGYLDDVEEDAALPIGKAELAAWWRRRQVVVQRRVSWLG